MSRRPSVASLSSIGSGLMKPISLPTVSESGSRPKPLYSNGSLGMLSRSISQSGNLEAIPERNADAWDPDELFTKYTVAEVKAVQKRLRGDADAKQEELRLMVGERYRDLLQASTSIISIAQSSNNVLYAVNEMRGAASSMNPAANAQVSVGGQGDENLQTLQSLAAHLKLLLDAPEHLWRFMERKLYLHAAWLLLLSRVVHRSLLRGEDDDDSPWHSLSIHISDQFPMVQRQWEAVSQFRSQISHKATIALREQSLSPPEVCAILLSLHLLESRPLPETLSAFLAQRTRSLNTILNRTKDRIPNGSAGEGADKKTMKPRIVVVRDVRQKLKAVIDVVGRTMGVSRRVFIGQSDDSSPLMYDVLRHIQSEDVTAAKSLPVEVRLTSHMLLTSLPSSNHFLLLPASIKSYRPYLDSSSLLASAKGVDFKAKLEDWFRKALQGIRSAMELWLAELGTIRELWEVRRWCKRLLQSTNGLEIQEISQCEAVLDSVCRQLAVEIWKTALHSSEIAFREHLTSAMKLIEQGSDAHSVDAEPVRYLFYSPSAPSSTYGTSTTTSSQSSFHTYRQSLQQQITGRTPLLDDVLSTVEERAKNLHEDLIITQEDSESNSNSTLASQLVEDYGRDVENLCSAITDTVQYNLDALPNDRNIFATVFLSRIADHLSSMTTFIENLGCTSRTAKEFRARMSALRDRALERWRDHTVLAAIAAYRMASSISHGDESITDGHAPSPRPSAQLLDSLLTLSLAMQTLGIHTNPDRSNTLIGSLLQRYVCDLLQRYDLGKDARSPVQISWDVAFLFLLVESWGSSTQEAQSSLLSALPWSTQAEWPPNLRENLSESLSRTQLLLGLLLPPLIGLSQAVHTKPSGLLQLGLPTVDAQYQSALELVKPSARFGLLLVGSSVAR